MTNDPNCLFCQIADGQVPAKLEYQDDEIVAFRDIRPRAPVHFLIVPRLHLESIAAISEKDGPLLGKMFKVANDLATREGIAETGYRLVTNAGPDAGQVVFHLHWHLLGGKPLGHFAKVSP